MKLKYRRATNGYRPLLTILIPPLRHTFQHAADIKPQAAYCFPLLRKCIANGLRLPSEMNADSVKVRNPNTDDRRLFTYPDLSDNAGRHESSRVDLGIDGSLRLGDDASGHKATRVDFGIDRSLSLSNDAC